MTESVLSPSRAIVLDVETTGLDPRDNHYIVEVAALELINMVPSSAYFHHYINPNRPDVPQEVVKIHGLTKDFLSDKPAFAELVDAFLAFIGDSPLIIHNAEFDMKFINAELERVSTSESADVACGLYFGDGQKRNFPARVTV